MSEYRALYRAWRPEKFRDIYGQERITTTLINQLESGHISHAYLFCGSRGTGKTTTAKVLARALNCEHPVDGEPCSHQSDDAADAGQHQVLSHYLPQQSAPAGPEGLADSHLCRAPLHTACHDTAQIECRHE